jgi:hypothetical protein
MKILYQSLKELEPEERRFLAEKYRIAVKPIVSDAVLAKRHRTRLKKYREKRVAIEMKLIPAIKRYEEQHQEEYRQALNVWKRLQCNATQKVATKKRLNL